MKSKLWPLCVLVLSLVFTQWTHAADPSEPRYGIKINQAWLEMPDGVRLAADLFMPEGAAQNERFPVLLEYLPYRKDESRARNYSLYSYFVQRGYIVARVDIRGTGNSQGRTIPYEYSDIELDDGEVVIDWLSRQHWSNGNVGIFGISWGGFNAIQLAVRNPPALKAFIALMATEELYGIIHTDSWMMSNDLYNALPGAPDFVMDEEWVRQRFDVEPSVYTYMRQQRDGPFWDRASARDKYDQIKIPGFHIGGWFDGYRNSLPRMLENVSAPVKALIGPWDHYFPHNAWPALVGSLAQGQRHRNHGRAGFCGLCTRLVSARSGPEGNTGSLALGTRMALEAWPATGLLRACRSWSGRCTGAGDHSSTGIQGVRRS